MFPYHYYFDPTIIIIIPAIIFALWAQFKVKSTFEKYSKLDNSKGLTGYEVARQILDENGLNDVRIERISGNLTDHYDPSTNTVRLSDIVYGSCSVSAIGVSAHEVGHAIQHATGYIPVEIRSTLVPLTNFGSNIGIWIIMIGILFANDVMSFVGIILFATATIFQLVTLPVEFNASRRAINTLENYHILEGDELAGSKKVLNAAAMTYVAALISSLATLLRLVLRVLISRDRRGR